MHPAIKLVGVFVDPTIDEVLAVTGRLELDIIQLHGDEDAETCRRISQAVYRPVWKAIPVATAADVARLEVWPVEAVLLDAPVAGRGGGGARFDHGLAREARARHPNLPIVLAGGLDPGNVVAAIRTVAPWAVDVASGVEAGPGIKDRAKLTAFVAAVRGAETPP